MTAIAIRDGYSDEQLSLIKRTVAKDATDDELRLFAQVCQRTGLDPFAKQIYCIHRGGKMGIQTAIDGYRLIAERTGRYAGQLGPFWCGEDGKWVDVWLSKKAPSAAKVGVIKDGFREPVWGVALWSAYAQSSPFWKPEGHGPGQLAKCAEALALRKAFPQELSAIRTMEEMEQADGLEYTPPNVPKMRAGQTEPGAPPKARERRVSEVDSERMDRDLAATVNGTLSPDEPPMAKIVDDNWVEQYNPATGDFEKYKRPSPTRFKRLQALRSDLKIPEKDWKRGLEQYKVESSTLLTADQTEHLIARLEKWERVQNEVRGKVQLHTEKVKEIFTGATEVVDPDGADKRAAAPTPDETPGE